MYEKYAMKKWVLFIAAILTLCSSVARADDPNDSHKKAIEIYSALAARYMLAKIYLNGEGVTQDYKKALLPRCRGNTKISSEIIERSTETNVEIIERSTETNVEIIERNAEVITETIELSCEHKGEARGEPKGQNDR